MSVALEQRAALKVVAGAAVDTAMTLLAGTSGTPKARRLQLLDGIPAVIGYYADGSSTLASDFYDDQRAKVPSLSRYSAEPIVTDRTVKIRSAIAWSAAPMFETMEATTNARLEEIVQSEVARPYRDTITTNRARDKQCIGWQRVTNGGCKFCAMLANGDVVYSEAGASFAAHPNCSCSAVPVFRGGEHGPEASVMQYKASQRGRSPAQRAQLRSYLNTYYPSYPG